MASWQLVWALTPLVGLAAAGLTGSGFALAAGRHPALELLHYRDGFTPLRLAALVVYAPLAVTRAGFEYLSHNPLIAFLIVALGIGWSFMQGVFILTALFGFT